MFGLGKILGSVVGGILDKIGLGKIAPFVKMGLNALTGNWLGVAKDVFGLVSNFKSNFMDKAANKPPLGAWDSNGRSFCGTNCKLDRPRMSGLMSGLKSLFSGFKAFKNGNIFGGFGKIFSAFRELNDALGNNQLYTNRSEFSRFNSIQV